MFPNVYVLNGSYITMASPRSLSSGCGLPALMTRLHSVSSGLWGRAWRRSAEGVVVFSTPWREGGGVRPLDDDRINKKDSGVNLLCRVRSPWRLGRTSVEWPRWRRTGSLTKHLLQPWKNMFGKSAPGSTVTGNGLFENKPFFNNPRRTGAFLCGICMFPPRVWWVVSKKHAHQDIYL